jgi:hypothetical protein
MPHSLRRIDVARSWALAKQQFAAVTAKRDALKRDLEWKTRDLAMAERNVRELREALTELRAATLARQEAEAGGIGPCLS